MAVKIRMKRLGRRHRPFYRICIMDSRSPRDGKAIEEVGYYDPMVREKSDRVQLKMERVEYWLSVGAQPTEKVAVLIDKVKSNRFGSVTEPPPMTPPKEPDPVPEAELESTTEEASAEESSENASSEETTSENASSEESSSEEATEKQESSSEES